MFSLEDCIEAVKLVKRELGTGFSSRDMVAKAMGYSGVTGASGTKISACVHFGLLTRSGNTYAISELSHKLITPISGSEEKEALIEAVSSPALYNKLITAYSEKALPGMLENILAREYGIIDNSAKRATEIFKKSLEYAGMLHNGVVRNPFLDSKTTAALADNTPQYDKTQIPNTNPQSNNATMPYQNNHDVFTIDLLNTGAKLLVPNIFSYAISTGELANEIKAIGEKLNEIKQKHKEMLNEKEK